MDFSTSFAISASGMALERTRVEVSMLNLANANTVQSAGGALFRPMKVIARAGVSAELTFGSIFESLGSAMTQPETSPSLGVVDVQIEPADTPPRRVLEPGHPLADRDGFVTYSGVDTPTEMLTLMSATRSYEANLAALNTARVLALKTLDIGGGS